MVKESSDRAFGFVFFLLFAIVGAWPLTEVRDPNWWSIAAAAVFLVFAVAYPSALAPLNRLWARLGRILHKLTNPVLMGLIFYLTVTPTGLLLRLFGKDVLKTKWDSSATTYWITREPPGPPPNSMKNQF